MRGHEQTEDTYLLSTDMRGMKTAAATALLLLLAVCVRSEQCQCATFLLGDVQDEHTVYAVPDTAIDSCNDTTQCANTCKAMFHKLTNNGDLQHMTSQGITVAELSCRAYRRDVSNGTLSAHYRVCGGGWKLAVATDTKLCCAGRKASACSKV